MSGFNMLYRLIPLNIMMGMECGNSEADAGNQNQQQVKICE
jgi:hypothetical protein